MPRRREPPKKQNQPNPHLESGLRKIEKFQNFEPDKLNQLTHVGGIMHAEKSRGVPFEIFIKGEGATGCFLINTELKQKGKPELTKDEWKAMYESM
ncbi:MAG: hypothetical protein ABIH20_02350 [Candidatus Diapherotrites archaeon]